MDSLLVINEVSSRRRTAVGANWAFDLWDLCGRSFLVVADYIAGHGGSAAKALPQSL